MRTEDENVQHQADTVRVAVDAMGGDFGLEPNVVGAFEALSVDLS